MEKDYREYASECLKWARTAKSHGECEAFLELAEAWLRAAALYNAHEKRAQARLSQLTCKFYLGRKNPRNHFRESGACFMQWAHPAALRIAIKSGEGFPVLSRPSLIF